MPFSYSIRLYTQALAKYPIVTQSVATATLFAAGDCIAQHIVESRPLAMHEWARTLRLSGFGLLVAGPALTQWYKLLDTIRYRQSTKTQLLCIRVCIDQFIFSPISMLTFFTVNGLMEGKSGPEIQMKLNSTYWEALVNNWKVWILVQAVNFSFVPLHHRLLVVNTVALGWNAYLSHLNHRNVVIQQ